MVAETATQYIEPFQNCIIEARATRVENTVLFWLTHIHWIAQLDFGLVFQCIIEGFDKIDR